MTTITETSQAVQFFRQASKNALKMLEQAILQDEEFKNFTDNLFSNLKIMFVFLERSCEFKMYQVKDDQIIGYFTINKKGELQFDEKNSFEGIEKVAAEAQKVVSKFYKREGK